MSGTWEALGVPAGQAAWARDTEREPRSGATRDPLEAGPETNGGSASGSALASNRSQAEDPEGGGSPQSTRRTGEPATWGRGGRGDGGGTGHLGRT